MSALGHNKTRMCYNARDGLKVHFLGVARPNILPHTEPFGHSMGNGVRMWLE